jgi:hypothetical protein
MDAPRCKIVNQQKDDVGRPWASVSKLMLPLVPSNERLPYISLDISPYFPIDLLKQVKIVNYFQDSEREKNPPPPIPPANIP